MSPGVDGTGMDLTNAAVGMKQAQTSAAIQTAVARKVMQSERANGDAAVQLIRAATEGVMQKSDALMSAATGLGGGIDVTG